MTYISSSDARRLNSVEEAPGFMVPADELFTCTCHGKRWPLSMLRMENNGQRHCPNQANPQGGSIDRDRLRDEERVELQRRATEDALPVKWPVTPLAPVACVHALVPPQQVVHQGSFLIPSVAQVTVMGENLSSTDLIEFTFDVAPGDAFLPPLPIQLLSYVTDGTSGVISVQVNGPVVDANLFYNGSEYDKVFLVR